MTDPTGQSSTDHEGTGLEPDPRDDEVLTMTRRQLRIIIRELLDLMLPCAGRRWPKDSPNVYVRLDEITPKELAR